MMLLSQPDTVNHIWLSLNLWWQYLCKRTLNCCELLGIHMSVHMCVCMLFLYHTPFTRCTRVMWRPLQATALPTFNSHHPKCKILETYHVGNILHEQISTLISGWKWLSGLSYTTISENGGLALWACAFMGSALWSTHRSVKNTGELARCDSTSCMAFHSLMQNWLDETLLW